jgi:formiminoglutamase
MDLSHYFSPLSTQSLTKAHSTRPGWLGAHIHKHTADGPPVVASGSLVLLGLKSSPDDDTPDWIRHFLYDLKAELSQVRVVDAGDTCFNKYQDADLEALRQAFEGLLAADACVVTMGGGQEATYVQYLAAVQQGVRPRLVLVDALADMAQETAGPLQPHTFVSHILNSAPQAPADISLLGYQYPLVSNAVLDQLKEASYELFRLSEVRDDFNVAEPTIRASHLLSFDTGSIRQADAPGTNHPLPSGLHAEEACRLARFAGLSPALQLCGFYEYNPAFDRHGQTAHLIAQAIWYFLEGYVERYHEHPLLDENGFYKYFTAVSDKPYQLLFFKSKKTGRWWMELPANPDSKAYGPIVPCAYEDYLAATRNHLPDRWLRSLQKYL